MEELLFYANVEGDISTNSPLDPAIVQAIKAAPKTGDVYSVTEQKQIFSEQILKVDVLTFQQGTTLSLSNYDVPWVAVVAKKLRFTDPESTNSLTLETDWEPVRFPTPSKPPAPPKGGKSGTGQDGPQGAAGIVGQNGQSGESAPKTPDIYFIVGEIQNQEELPIPKTFNFLFDVRGYNGGDGGNGGPGSDGGEGGDGGPGDYHPPERYPLNPGCVASAGRGGPGGIGGTGGPGGEGGNGSDGATLHWVGPSHVLDALYYSRVYNQPGHAGHGGYSGTSGVTGPNGARGEHPGTCKGGDVPFPRPNTPESPHVRNVDGKSGQRGKIFKTEKAIFDF
jgi:hypothetical protein